MQDLTSEDNQARLDTRTVMLTIIGFWVFYYLIVTLRTWVLAIPSFNELAYRRGIVVFLGIGITAILWRALRPFDRQPLGWRVAAAVLVAVPCSIAVATVNYYFFNVYDPAGLSDIDQALPPDLLRPSAIQDIAEVAITRYFFLIAWAALYFALGFAHDVRLAERRTAAFAQAAQTAELRALRYQVNPHFLFNTLNSLSALVLGGRRDEAEAMIMKLSTFYRTSLSSEPSEDVTLAEEIALQRLYLDVEAVRFPERLSIEMHIPEALQDCRIPGLILQPLVENAIKHGVSPTHQPVVIRLAAEASAGHLHVHVDNTGSAARPAPAPDGHGIGLANVRDRLAARYGDAASLEAGPLGEAGWRAQIIVPLERFNG
jgi:two-component sensor histidine kinase